jgi:hypothetical protein
MNSLDTDNGAAQSDRDARNLWFRRHPFRASYLSFSVAFTTIFLCALALKHFGFSFTWSVEDTFFIALAIGLFPLLRWLFFK